MRSSFKRQADADPAGQRAVSMRISSAFTHKSAGHRQRDLQNEGEEKEKYVCVCDFKSIEYNMKRELCLHLTESSAESDGSPSN